MEEALLERLTSDGAITTLVGNRVTWMSRPQATGLPSVTLQRVTGGPLYTNDGEAGLSEGRVQIDCWAKTYTSVKAVARAVRTRLSALRDTVDGVRFATVMLDSEQDLREGGSNAAEYLHRVRMDFIIWHDS